jgi:hypothetical protein
MNIETLLYFSVGLRSYLIILSSIGTIYVCMYIYIYRERERERKIIHKKPLKIWIKKAFDLADIT